MYRTIFYAFIDHEIGNPKITLSVRYVSFFLKRATYKVSYLLLLTGLSASAVGVTMPMLPGMHICDVTSFKTTLVSNSVARYALASLVLEVPGSIPEASGEKLSGQASLRVICRNNLTTVPHPSDRGLNWSLDSCVGTVTLCAG